MSCVPGHSSAQVGAGIIDDVAYLADALISEEVMKGSKVPCSFALKDDLESKAGLRRLRRSAYIVAHKGL
ncbi:MAG: hypothetical protein NT061_11665 [Spirochaetes bacterium]|nr:hypothetical protein [Spirochaetota bacterium]